MKKKNEKKEDAKAPAVRMKTILVTGSNRGIGFGIVEALLKDKKTYKVIMTARNEEQGNTIFNELSEKYPEDKERFFFHQLDLLDENSVTELVAWIKKTFKKIDYIVNNAGVSSKGTKFDSEVVDFTLNTNYFGTVQFTEKLLSESCLNKQGKIIMVSSLGANVNKLKNEELVNTLKNAKNVDEINKLADKFKQSVAEGTVEEEGWIKNAYTVSKILLNCYTRIFSHRKDVTKEQCSVYLCDPGWTKTEQGGEFAPQTIEEGADEEIFLITQPDGINKENQGKFFFKHKIVPVE